MSLSNARRLATAGLVSLVLVAACDRGSEAAPAKAAAAGPAADAKTADAKTADAKTPTTPPPTDKPVDAKTPTTPVPTTGVAVVTPPVVPPPALTDTPVVPAAPTLVLSNIPVLASTPVAAAATTPTWREVARPSESVAFESLTRGVLARSTAGLLDVDSTGALVLRADIEAPKGPVLGFWPDNAWVIETRTKEHKDDRSGDEDRQTRLVRLRNGKRWVPQEYKFEQRFDDRGESFAVSPKMGMLVQRGCVVGFNDHDEPSGVGGKLADCNADELTRVSDNRDNPVVGAGVGGTLVGAFETRAGEIYMARERDGSIYVQTHCADEACVAANARRLPDGQQWSFTRPVARQKNSVSVVATLSATEARSHLLHYGSGGWQLDGLDAAPSGLWPVDDGGVWTLVGDALLHRDPTGAWRQIVLPEGATEPSVAVSGDGNELWLAAQVGGASVVFATTARAQTPAAAPAEPAAPEAPAP